MSDYTYTRHPRRERGSSARDGKLNAIHGVWIRLRGLTAPAIPAGMTILNGAFIEYDKVELKLRFPNASVLMVLTLIGMLLVVYSNGCSNKVVPFRNIVCI
ncbi:hypothetical protein [Methylicorpusculum sp.]|uniref:hypothetical protein n=1 Tax=Methylicorpusculum sp. TaxID=2713644 RepID=UPI00271C62E0|nr:hypothetical protein [Methylicorpusculum sp.]MDO8846534.1 hypothetical protein [Methylicorpusculum sp.]